MIINNVNCRFGSSNPKTAYFEPNNSLIDQTSRANRIFRDQGAGFRLGLMLPERFNFRRARKLKIGIHAASLGNQRIDIVMGVMARRLLKMANDLKTTPAELIKSTPDAVRKALNYVGQSVRLSASDVDPRIVKLGQEGTVHYYGQEAEQYKNPPKDYFSRLFATTTPKELTPLIPVIDELYRSLVTEPSNVSFIVDPKGAITSTNYTKLRRVMGPLRQADAFQEVTRSSQKQSDVLVSANWLPYFLADPHELPKNIDGVRTYLAKATEIIKPGGLLVLGGLDISTGLPALLPKGRFQPIRDKSLLIEKAAANLNPVDATKESYIFERIA